MICTICRKEVKPNQHYLVLEEFKNKKPSGRNYYHAQCFQEKFMVQNKMMGMMNNMNNFLQGMAEKMDIKKEVKYEV